MSGPPKMTRTRNEDARAHTRYTSRDFERPVSY
jgi:hypothetical protein